MTSVHSSSLDVDEVDLSGLVESVVDSDEEDLAESMDVRISCSLFYSNNIVVCILFLIEFGCARYCSRMS